jgi:hypothetical protein
VEIEVSEIGDRFVSTVLVSKETGLDSTATRSLQQELQHGRGIDDDHAESRSSRTAAAAGVFSFTRFSTAKPGQHLLACGPRGETLEFGK